MRHEKGGMYMGMFDKMYSGVTGLPVGFRTESFTFTALPESLAEMQALPEADLRTPFRTAALTVCALCAYSSDKESGIEMLNWLRGSRQLSGQEISALDNSFSCGRNNVMFSYFAGAAPENGFTPAAPYTLNVCSNHNSGVEQGYMTLLIPGSDGLHPVKLRMKEDGRWFLWEQYLFPDAMHVNSAGAWA